MEQLLFFKEDEVAVLKREIQTLRESHEKVRRKQFAQLAELNKLYMQTWHEFELLKASICKVSPKPIKAPEEYYRAF